MGTDILGRRSLLRGLVDRLVAADPSVASGASYASDPTPDTPPDPAEPGGPGGTDFFASFETAYALIDECRPFLKAEAERMGLDASAMSELDLVRALFGSAEGPPDSDPPTPRSSG